MITFVAFTPSSGITLQDVIKKYGHPDRVAVWGSGIPEHARVDASVFYGTMSTRLVLPEQDGAVYDLQPDAMIHGVSYLSPQEHANHIEVIKEFLQAWKDYGEY